MRSKEATRALGRAGIALCTALLLVAGAATAAYGKTKASDGDYYLGHHAPGEQAPNRDGVVITLHGGGWEGDLGADADRVMAPYISDLQAWGYGVYNVGYQSNRESLPDTLDAVRRVSRRKTGRGVCLLGGSAGAQLALIAAALMPKRVDCVVDIGGPPNLKDPDTQLYSSAVPDLATKAFGRKRLREMSPINRVKEILAAVLVVAPDCDYFTSLRRQQRFVERLLHGVLVVENAQPAPTPPANLLDALLSLLAPPSGVETGHCRVTSTSFNAFREAELAFLNRNLG